MLHIPIWDVHIFTCIVDSGYWKNLTLGKSFLVRVFVDYCKSAKQEARLEQVLPVVTAVAFQVQDTYNQLAGFLDKFNAYRALEDVDEKELQKLEEEKHSREFVLAELLKLAVYLDYSDETGRRKTFQLVRESYGIMFKPNHVSHCYDRRYVRRRLTSRSVAGALSGRFEGAV